MDWRHLAAVAALAATLAACATHSPAVSPAPGTAAAASEPPPKESIESQHDPFVKSCLEKTESRDYCECGFEQFKEAFKDADLSKPIPKDDPRIGAIQERTVAACSSKLSEDQIKGAFLKGCAGDETRKQPYCTCAWSSLRRTLKPIDFVGSLEDERFVKPRKGIAVDCKGKYPPDMAKAEFVNSCSAEKGMTPARCECLWKKVRAKWSVEEIAVGTADLASVPGTSQCQ
jgi:hypothetical protein